MSKVASDKVFAGSVPLLYERYLVPLIFTPYSADLAKRVVALEAKRVLEIAAGTGVATRAMDAVLAPEAAIVATDLNPAMLEEAKRQGASARVTWREADAMQLPFEDHLFDVVACQFGAMFFPDKAKAFAEVRRVLRPGGRLVFSVWDRIEENVFADDVTQALAKRYPGDPPRFLARTPHGYHDAEQVCRDVAAAAFARVALETVAFASCAASARDPAIAYCQGTPLRNEIEARDPKGLTDATETAALAIVARHGSGPVEAKIQAHIVVAVA